MMDDTDDMKQGLIEKKYRKCKVYKAEEGKEVILFKDLS